MHRILRSLVLTALALLVPTASFAQAPALVQLTTPFVGGSYSAMPTIVVVPISATAAVNTQTTLTIPTPPGGLSNYVCSLAYTLNNDNTGTAASNVVSTSTNFNSFAVKVSQIATASIDNGMMVLFNLPPGGGCVKSTIPGTATTFVSPAAVTHGAWTWLATYYQAP